MRIRPLQLLHHRLLRITLLLAPSRQRRQSFRQAKVEIDRLNHNQRQTEPRRRRKRIRRHCRNRTQIRTQPRPKGKGNREARADEGHGRSARGRIRDVAGHGRRQLDVALGEAADDAARDKGAEVDGGDPEEDGEDVAGHGGEEGFAAAVAVGEGADQGGGNRLEESVRDGRG